MRRGGTRDYARNLSTGIPHFAGTPHCAETLHFAETSLSVETLHRAETFPPHSMFYFRATKSFRVNCRPGPDSGADTGRTDPGTLTLPLASTTPR
jgi:hypothetical protein